jgi:predicted DNA-binding protein
VAVKEGRCRFMIQLDNDKKALLQRLANEEGRSLSNYINRIIDLYLAEKKGQSI